MTTAQPTLDDVTREEAGLRWTAFDAATAWRLGSALHDRGERDGLCIAIEISVAGHVLFVSALPGATPDNTEWMRRKRNTVMRFHRSSLAMRLLCEAKGKSLSERYGLAEADYVASGGGHRERTAGCRGSSARRRNHAQRHGDIRLTVTTSHISSSCGAGTRGLLKTIPRKSAPCTVQNRDFPKAFFALGPNALKHID